MKLLELLKEQYDIMFTGRVNILSTQNQSVGGSIFLKEGVVFHATYQGKESYEALKLIYLRESFKNDLTFILEPEIVDGLPKTVCVNLSNLEKDLSKLKEQTSAAQEQLPPSYLKIELLPILMNANLSEDEFELTKTICDFSKIEQIYNKCPMEEYRVTNALVSLRRKKLIKVIGE